MPRDIVSIAIDPAIANEVSRRQTYAGQGTHTVPGRSTIVNRDLERYYWMLGRGGKEIKGLFSQDELTNLCEVLQWTVQTHPPMLGVFEGKWRAGMLAVLADDDEDRVPKDLLGKLRGLTDLQELALLDALERWNVSDKSGEVLG